MANGNQPADKNLPVDQEMIKTWMKNQTLELQNQKQENEIRIKEIDANTKLSIKSLEIQEKVVTNQGKEIRSTLTRVSLIAMVGVVIILLFLGFCLYTGNKDFAYKFCQGVSYIVTTALGFWFGKKSSKQQAPEREATQEQVF